jgi:glycosyltransferase involved in cell wall biosynthesis
LSPSRGLRVALVSEHASPLAALGGVDAGGQNVYVAELARHLSRDGAEVKVFTRRDSARLPPSVPFLDGVEVCHVDAGPAEEVPKDDLLPYMGRFSEELFEAWRRRPPDVVHAHFWMSGLASLEAGALLSIPVVQTFHALGHVKRRHQGNKDTSPPGRAEVESRLARDVARIVATCSDEERELVALGADEERVSVVPCGVDLACHSPVGPALPARGRRSRVVMVGRLVERKGHAEAIEALAELPGTELLVAGGPEAAGCAADPEIARLRAVADSCSVADRVVFLGRLEQRRIAALLRSADVVWCTPWYEPFGIVPLEAMACGVPVVASAVGGMLDSVAHGETGFLVPPHRPEAIAAATAELLARPELRVSFGRAGTRRVRRLFSWPRVAAGVLSAYGRVLEEQSRPMARRSA